MSPLPSLGIILLVVCVHHTHAWSPKYPQGEKRKERENDFVIDSTELQCSKLRRELHELKQSPCNDVVGWIPFQRRMDGSVNFYRSWNEYLAGFGDPSGEFWIGLDEISRLMKLGTYELRIDMEDFEGNWRYAYYRNFHVGEYRDNFPITTSGYIGDAGNSLQLSKVPFSTKDRDHDSWPDSCAVTFKGAWWYTDCHASNLNGQYLRGSHESHADGVNWWAFRGHYYSLKFTEMKMRLRA